MHSIPSILPSLYDWGFWVPFFFRLFLAYQIILEARGLLVENRTDGIITLDHKTLPSTRKALAGILFVVGLFLLVGLGVQIVAVFVACAYLFLLGQTARNPDGQSLRQHLLLLLALLSFSLLFLGPGPYAIDLPL